MIDLGIVKKAFIRHRGLFVTGTDTNIGKTYVACLLARLWREEGMRVGVLKPFESGAGGDAAKLRRAAGLKLPLSAVRPFAFKRPLAPAVAARYDRIKPSFEPALQAFTAMGQGRQGVLVEGAGGLLVPLTASQCNADLARAMKLPLLVVARPGLGTINHTLLTLEAARARGLLVVAVLLNGKIKRGDASWRNNPAEIRRLGRIPVLGPLAWGH